ncbi:MAG TPA: hypothetical protein DCS93_21305 [Microscillaceae bacterium]|nr:hypothetical protein [Microscillaceae bacterium]
MSNFSALFNYPKFTMKEHHILYKIALDYDEMVQKGYYEFLIKPHHDSYQRVSKVKIEHSLEGEVFLGKNRYEHVTYQLRIKQKFQHFQLTFSAMVQKQMPDYFFNILEATKEYATYLQHPQMQIELMPFLRNTQLTALRSDLIPPDFYRTANEPLLIYLQRLNKLIQSQLEVIHNQAEGATYALKVLQTKKANSQGLNHLLIGLLRHQNIPARYVSGYLNTQEANEPKMHMWVEVYFAALGWLGVDPYRQTLEDEDYLKIAHGRDYTDVEAIKSHLQGASALIKNNTKNITQDFYAEYGQKQPQQ